MKTKEVTITLLGLPAHTHRLLLAYYIIKDLYQITR